MLFSENACCYCQPFLSTLLVGEYYRTVELQKQHFNISASGRRNKSVTGDFCPVHARCRPGTLPLY